jgi:agmatinase
MYGSDVEPVRFDDAAVAVFPVPYEASVSYGGGTAAGPQAILKASAQVELHDEWLGVQPWRAGVWTEPEPDLPESGSAAVMDCITNRFGALMDAGRWVVMLGGEHSITAGGVQAAARRHPGLKVLQLDAHADLRDSYQGDANSHACAAARCLELAPVNAVGIRSYSPEEAARIRDGIPGYQVVHAWEMTGDQDLWIGKALAGLEGAPVYLTVDLDYFDPGILPATGTPEPGGGSWWPTLNLLRTLFRTANVVAADVVELAPLPGLHHADFLAARLVSKLIAMKFEKQLLALP